jgi:catalase
MSTIGLGQESLEPGENEAIAEIVEQIRSDLVNRAQELEWTTMRRDGHPKAHGLVRAQFTIAGDLPEALARGVFAAPRTFEAYIRFSNAYFDPDRHDVEPDFRGMAIKLLGVPGPKELPQEPDTQDFLLVTRPVFFVRDPRDYLEFIRILKESPALCAVKYPHFARLLGIISNPLTTTYFSQTAYALGDGQAVKYCAQPAAGEHASLAKELVELLHRDYLRHAMAEWLREQEAAFDFLVQLQTDPVRMPVEDPTVEWDAGASPFRKVATIVIPKQEFQSPAQESFGENLSFNPWHALGVHRPLGIINRIRRAVYLEISALRHRANQVPEQEPSGDEQF